MKFQRWEFQTCATHSLGIELQWSLPPSLHTTQPQSHSIYLWGRKKWWMLSVKRKETKKTAVLSLAPGGLPWRPCLPQTLHVLHQATKVPETSWVMAWLCKSVATLPQVANDRTSKLQELFKLSFCDGRLAFTYLFLFLHLRICVQYFKITCYIKMVV